MPIRVQLQYRQHVLREIRANVTAYVSISDLGSVEERWAPRERGGERQRRRDGAEDRGVLKLPTCASG